MNIDPNDGINVWEITYMGDHGFKDSVVKRICADTADDAIHKSIHQDWNQDVNYIGKIEIVALNV